MPGSPCINAGDPNFPIDANEVDIDGDQRIIEDRIDIGADEYRGCEICDLNSDGSINFSDYAVFAYYWIEVACTEPGLCQGSDFDKDRKVDWSDLKTFVECWLWHRIESNTNGGL